MKIFAAIAALMIIFLGYVSTRPSHFHYEKSGVINAPADKIFPYLHNFKLGSQWNPYEKKDPSMKKEYSGPDAGPGAKMSFDGNSDVGSGTLEVMNEIPNSSVDLKLEMTKPMNGTNMIHYSLTPDGIGTRFTWAMEGDGGFLMKLISVFINCEKMMTAEFVTGIANLKSIVEKEAPNH